MTISCFLLPVLNRSSGSQLQEPFFLFILEHQPPAIPHSYSKRTHFLKQAGHVKAALSPGQALLTGASSLFWKMLIGPGQTVSIIDNSVVVAGLCHGSV